MVRVSAVGEGFPVHGAVLFAADVGKRYRSCIRRRLQKTNHGDDAARLRTLDKTVRVLRAKENQKIFHRDGNRGMSRCVRPIANHTLSRN
jgi:hypothetical protein